VVLALSLLPSLKASSSVQGNLIASPDRIEVATGGYNYTTIEVANAVGDFELVASQLPSRVGINFQPTLGTSTANTTFVSHVNFAAATDAELGEFEVNIVACYAGFNLTTKITVVVETSTDLVPNDFGPSVQSPDVNQTIALSASVANLGYGNPGEVKAEFFRNEQFLSNVTNSIGPMQSVTFTIHWTPNQSETDKNVFTIVVDPDHQISETTRENNNATTEVCVGCRGYSFRLETNGLADNSARVFVDGNQSGTVSDASPWEKTFQILEPHKIAVEQCVPRDNSVKMCTNSYEWNTPETLGTKAVSYLPQYSVLITSSPRGSPEPVYSRPIDCPQEGQSCWYDPTTTPILYISWRASQTFENSTRWMLKDVELDGKSLQPDLSSFELTMNQPHTFKLHHVRQYFLNLTSDYSTVSGSGWYDENSFAKWKLHQSTIQVNSCEGQYWATVCPTWILSSSNGTAGTLEISKPTLGRILWSRDQIPTLLANLLNVVLWLATAFASSILTKDRVRGWKSPTMVIVVCVVCVPLVLYLYVALLS
jgi:hypothetical protein